MGSYQILLIEAAPYPASLYALPGAPGFERARVADGRPRCVPYGPLPVIVAFTEQELAFRTGVEIFFGVVSEGVSAEQGSALFVVDQRHVGADARFLYGRYVLCCAIGGICGNRAWLEMPTEATPEEQLEHGEVLGDLSRRH